MDSSLSLQPAGRPALDGRGRQARAEASRLHRPGDCISSRRITSRKIKATLPAPALLGERMWHPEKSAKAYPKRDDFVRDCVPILQRELELIREAGADIIQIDDPHLCLFVDPDVRAQYPNPDAAADFAVDMVNAIVDGSQERQASRAPVPPRRRARARRGAVSGRLRVRSSIN